MAKVPSGDDGPIQLLVLTQAAADSIPIHSNSVVRIGFNHEFRARLRSRPIGGLPNEK